MGYCDADWANKSDIRSVRVIFFYYKTDPLHGKASCTKWYCRWQKYMALFASCQETMQG